MSRTLSLAYSAKKAKFGGKLAPQAPACIAEQSVTVYEKNGFDPKLGSAKTNDAGKYWLEEKNAEGKFYGRAKRTSTSVGTCLAAQSKTVKVG